MSIYIDSFKKTKIIATVGPASAEKIEALLAAGVNGIRLNFSHGTHTEHRKHLIAARIAAKKLDRGVAVIQDLAGPKIRLGSLPGGSVTIESGMKLHFKFGADGSDDHLPIQYDFAGEVSKGQPLYLRDGQIRTIIESVKGGVVTVRALNSGKILSNHGINLPETHFKSSVLTKKDRADLEFAYKEDVDYVALSFVQSARDIVELRKLLHEHKSRAKIITKLETKVATEHLEDIIRTTDVVMIARGDLAVETAAEDVPMIGREIITLARRYKRPVIMATQMLESMMHSLQPSRAEVSDISSAVTLGVDSVMLSGETAIGDFPVETVQLMKKVILSTEQYLHSARSEIDVMPTEEVPAVSTLANDIGPVARALTRSRRLMHRTDVGKVGDSDAQISVSLAAITLAEQLGAQLILAETMTGSTALSIASLRPSVPIIIASPEQRVVNQLAILWGSKPFLVKKRTDAEKSILAKLKKRRNINSGDMIVLAYGKMRGVAGGTDTVRLLEVP